MSPRDMFLIFLMGEPIGCCKHAPPGMFLIFLKWWELDFPSSSHEISLVPINSPSKSFCSHQVLKKFPSHSSCSHQVPIVPINFLLFPTQPHINPHKALNFVRDSDSRVLKLSATVPEQAGRGSYS